MAPPCPSRAHVNNYHTGKWFRFEPPNFSPDGRGRRGWRREMKRQRPEAAGDRLALADQSGCDVPAQPNGKARALPACEGQPVNHDGSATAE